MIPISISIVLPTYNEEENLRDVIANATAALASSGADYEILICNDGSTDETARIGNSLAVQEPKRIQVLSHPQNLGYGAALRTGFRAASKELVFFTDCDNQFRFDELPAFISKIEDRDMVIGYRRKRRDPWNRWLNSRIGNHLAKWMLGVRVKDINCAYKLFRRSLLSQLPLQSDGALINTELLAYANTAGWRFIEIPVNHYPRLHGKQTGAKLSVILKTFREYFQLRERLVKAKSRSDISLPATLR